MLGSWSWIMPVFVAMSAFGGLSVHIMTSSRLCFVGARQGHLPDMLALINVKKLTPAPSLIFLGFLSLCMLCTSDVYTLIDYSSFIESMFIMWSVAGLLWLRYKEPSLPRPIKVSLVIPILFLLICCFLVFLPIYVRPYEVGAGLLITATGIPFYFVGIYWQNKPQWFISMSQKLTASIQKLTLAVKEDWLYKSANWVEFNSIEYLLKLVQMTMIYQDQILIFLSFLGQILFYSFFKWSLLKWLFLAFF